MKVCTNKDCIHKGKLQEESNFNKDSQNYTNNGLSFQCKDCKKENDKKRYNITNIRERKKRLARKHHHKNKDERNKKRRELYHKKKKLKERKK